MGNANQNRYLKSNLPQKFKLSFILLLNNPIYNKGKSTFLNSLNDFSDIKNLLNDKDQDQNITKYLYYNKDFVQKMLYDLEEFLFLPSYNEFNFSYFFYLSLLITENVDIINYIYKIDLIEKLNDTNKKNKLLKKIICSKFIIELIYNFKGFDNYEEYKDILNSIEKENMIFIHNNIDYLSKFNLNENQFRNIKIDEIYMIIISNLISNNKFDDIEYIHEIIMQLDLENIVLNKSMIDKLLDDIQNISKLNINIVNIEDLTKKDIINFYYLLLKYILKNSIYIYQVPFLLKKRTNIIKIIKSNHNISQLINLNNNIYNERLDFVIRAFTDLDYYYYQFKEKIKETIISDNSKKIEINKNRNKKENTSNENDQKDNNSNKIQTKTRIDYSNSETYINNSTINNVEQYEKQIDKNDNNNINDELDQKNENCIKNNYISEISQILTKYLIKYSSNNNNKNNMDYSKLIELKTKIKDFKLNKNENLKYISLIKLINCLQEIDRILTNECNNKKIEIEFNFSIDKVFTNKNGIYNIICYYNFNALNRTYKDENILINGIKQGFQALLCDILYEYFN